MKLFSHLILFLLLSCQITGPTQIKILDLLGKQKKTQFNIKIAYDQKTQEKGLMFKKSMPLKDGMLFIFPPQSRIGFWMKNTFIDLDLIFIDSHGKIVDFHQGAKAHDETIIGSRFSYMYCLEVNAGRVKALQIKRGDRVQLLP